MELRQAHALFSLLEADRSTVLYSGRFHDGHSAGLIAIGESLSAAAGRDKAHRQRLSFIMVEAYQNILRHRADLPAAVLQGEGRSLFALRVGEASDEVIAMDAVTMADVEAMEPMLRQIGRSDIAQLKNLFLARLRDGSRTARGGAGLGLIEMARRSAKGLHTAWLPLDEAHRLFVLQMMVGASPAVVTEKIILERIHKLVAQLNLIIACRCMNSAEAQEAVLRMAEGEAEGEDARRIAHAFLATNAWLRKHGYGEQAFLAMARERDVPVVAVAIKTGQQEATLLQDQLTRIGLMPETERDFRFRQALLGRTASVDIDSDLLELARLAHGAIDAQVVAEEGSAWLLFSVRLDG
ncbi:MAG: hypothetical protein IPM46_02575 [Flavobacteriales bacterium]|nr:hypothetical protein [Flavobacteriales bacterium]